ncbi:MAG: hypothetical protein AseanaTS_03070 [Candidatus Pelagadaptatus aseana]|uniref:alpha/beta fold hydrolase n=1 Tax=Candidatus Pelagadaptatus aseana TaxID=3120508 RepID=UPI0039B2FF98
MSKSQSKVVYSKGNTPLNYVPEDYLPAGATGQWLVLREGVDAGKKLFFYDVTVGDGEPEATLFFVHGNPECSYTYRQTMEQVIAQTDKTLRIIAMDHIGFGLSDQASFEMVDYHHTNNLKQLIAHLNVTDVTLVIHDWGGAIGVGAFIDSPQRVSSLVLMNTTIFPMPAEGDTYTNFPFPGPLAWNRLGTYLPWRVWKHVPPMVMFSPASKPGFALHGLKFALRSLTGQLNEEEKMYRRMFRTEANARSSMRNVKQTRVWGHGYRYFDDREGWQDNREFYRNMQAKIGACWGPKGQNIPVRGFFGLFDPCAKTQVQQQWLDALPQLQGYITCFENRGHFVEEHEPQAIASGIVSAAGL